MRAFLAIAFTAAVVTPSIARADQCAINDALINARAAELARKSASVIEYCEPCKGSTMSGPFKIQTIDVKKNQVEINGKPVDLAYTFIHTKGDEFANLGLAAGCNATGISRVIKSQKPAIAPPPQAPTQTRVPPPMPTNLPPPPVGNRTPPPRVTSGDDIAGTWSVWLRPSVSTCGALSTNTKTVTWTITSSGGTLSLITDTGRELVATVPPIDRGSLRIDLKNSRQAQSGAAHIDQFLKDNFFGQLVVIEKGCANAYTVSGKRVP